MSKSGRAYLTTPQCMICLASSDFPEREKTISMILERVSAMWIPFREQKADWVLSLLRLYDKQANVNRETAMMIPHKIELDYVPTYHELDTDKERIQNGVDYLELMDYIETRSENGGYQYRLNKDGLELAHRIKTERQRGKTNILLLWLTVALTVLTVVLVVAELGYI